MLIALCVHYYYVVIANNINVTLILIDEINMAFGFLDFNVVLMVSLGKLKLLMQRVNILYLPTRGRGPFLIDILLMSLKTFLVLTISNFNQLNCILFMLLKGKKLFSNPNIE